MPKNRKKCDQSLSSQMDYDTIFWWLVYDWQIMCVEYSTCCGIEILIYVGIKDKEEYFVFQVGNWSVLK